MTKLVTRCIVARMSLGGMLLGLLEQEPGHGYDLKTRHDRHFATRRLALPQVYATLGRLERDGRVAMTGVQRGGGPDRTLYAVTPSGVQHFEGWLVEPEGIATYLQSTVFSKVLLAMLSGRRPDQVVEVQRAEHRRQMRELTARKRSASMEEGVALDLALFHLEADLRWLHHVLARLDDLREAVR